MAADNKSLGRFNLDGIPPAPRGMPKIEVSFDIDANGILSVKAKDQTTNKEQSIRIEASSGLTEADVEKMRGDADINPDADKRKKELAEAQNAAEQLPEFSPHALAQPAAATLAPAVTEHTTRELAGSPAPARQNDWANHT